MARNPYRALVKVSRIDRDGLAVIDQFTFGAFAKVKDAIDAAIYHAWNMNINELVNSTDTIAQGHFVRAY
jgi:hypothetical protein